MTQAFKVIAFIEDASGNSVASYLSSFTVAAVDGGMVKASAEWDRRPSMGMPIRTEANAAALAQLVAQWVPPHRRAVVMEVSA